MTNTSGSRTAASDAQPSPIHAPKLREQLDRELVALHRQPAVTCGPLIASASPPAGSKERGRALRVRSAACARASRVSADPDAYCSQQPRCPQPHGKPSGTTRTWPSSAANPYAPRTRSPSTTMAAPRPGADREHHHGCRASAPAPYAYSAQPAALASFSTTTVTSSLANCARARCARAGSRATRCWARTVMCSRSERAKPAAASPTAVKSYARAKLGDRVGDRRVDTRRVLAAACDAGPWRGCARRRRQLPRRSWFRQYRLLLRALTRLLVRLNVSMRVSCPSPLALPMESTMVLRLSP